MSATTLEDIIREDHAESWKLEQDGIYKKGGERVLPFNKEIVKRALRVAVKMRKEEKIPKADVYIRKHAVHNATMAVLKALWNSGHPDAVRPRYIEDFRVEVGEGIPPDSWKVVYEGNMDEITIAEL